MKTLLVLMAMMLPPDSKDRPINSAQNEHDRTIGRVVDPQTHELNRIGDERSNAPQLQQINRDTERQEIEDRNARRAEPAPANLASPAPPPIPADHRAYDADQQRMEKAREDLAREMLTAVDQRDRSLRDLRDPNAPEAIKIQEKFRNDVNVLVHRYEVRYRAMNAPAPTTQPIK